MKRLHKLLAITVLCAGLGTCAVANAQWRHGGGHYVYRPGYGWVVPSIVGGVIGYELAQPRRPDVVIVQPVYPAPQVVPPPAPAGYHYEAIVDAACNCYKTVLIAN